MKLLTRVMHDSRRPWPGKLVEAFAGEEDPSFSVIQDFEHRGPWDTARACWTYFTESDRDGTHILVVQDDAIPSPGVAESIHAALTARPNDIVSFFGVRGDYAGAAQRKIHWIESEVSACGLAVAMPVDMAARFVDWCDEMIDPEWTADDGRLALFAAVHGLSIWFTAPSLFQHDPGGHNVSNGTPNSVLAPWVAKRGPLLDWSGPGLLADGDQAGYVQQRRSKFK